MTLTKDLFRKTEPQAQPEQVSFIDDTPATKKARTTTRNTPTSVYIPLDLTEDLNAMMTATGCNKHSLIQYAVREMLRRWKETGEAPETETVTMTVTRIK